MNTFYKLLGWTTFIVGLLLIFKFLFYFPKTPVILQVVGAIFAVLGFFMIGKHKWALVAFGIVLTALIVFVFYLFGI
jgi:hypothetical protein